MRPSVRMLAILVAAAATFAVSTPAASALPSPCDAVGLPLVPDPAERACEKVAGAVGHVTGDLAGDAAKAFAQPIFRQATEWVAQGAGWLVGRVGSLIDTSTTPRLQGRWFTGQYAEMGLLATALALPLLFLAVIHAAVARNATLISRALAAVPVAFVLTGGAVAVVAALLGVTDWACQAISGQAGPNSREFFHDVAGAFETITDDGGTGGAAPALFVALLASIFAALAALAVWIELLIRSAGIYVCVLFFPVVLVARIWPKLEKWTTRLAEALTALILSKFVIVAVLSVAAAALADSRASEGFNGVLAAGALLVFAAFAPLVLFRLVQFADPQIHARAGGGGTLTRGGQTTMSAAQAARVSMDRHAAGGGLRNIGAAGVARTPLLPMSGGLAIGGSSGASGGAGSARRADRLAVAQPAQSSGGSAGEGDTTRPRRVATPSVEGQRGGSLQSRDTPGRGGRGPSTATTQPARRTTGGDRIPADLGPPGPPKPGDRGRNS